MTINDRWAEWQFIWGSVAAESTAEKYSSRSDPERALPTPSNLLTALKTFNDLPATSSQRGAQSVTT
jgi:hypothetical protein